METRTGSVQTDQFLDNERRSVWTLLFIFAAMIFGLESAIMLVLELFYDLLAPALPQNKVFLFLLEAFLDGLALVLMLLPLSNRFVLTPLLQLVSGDSPQMDFQYKAKKYIGQRLLVSLMVTTFVTEFFVMMVIHAIYAHEHTFFDIFADSSILILVLIPLLYFIVFQPFVIFLREYRAAEERLQNSEERYRDLFENAHDLIQAVDAEGKFVYVNRQWKSVLGYKDEVIGKLTFLEVIHEKDRAHCLKLFEETKSGKSIENVEASFISKDGHEIIVEGNINAHFKDGEFLYTRGIFRNITKKKQMETALRESEKKFRLLADFAYDWEYWIDKDSKMVYVSPSCERITGYRPEEFYADPHLVEGVVYPDDRPLYREHMRVTLEGEKRQSAVEFEYRITSKKGQVRWVGHLCHPVLDDKGKIIGRRVSSRDITHRKQMEAALLRSEERFRRLANLAPDSILMVDQDEKIIYCNGATTRIFGYELLELMNSHIKSIVPEFYQEQARLGLSAIKKTRELKVWRQSMTIPLKKKDGAQFFAEISLASFVTEEGWNAIVIIRDVSQRKAMEKELAQSEERFRKLAASAPDAIIVVESNERLSYWNEAAEKIFGYLAKEALGQELHQLITPEKYREKEKEGFERFRKTGTGPLIGKIVETEGLKKDGTIFPLELALSAFETGKGWTAIGIVRDITERKRIEAELQEANLNKEWLEALRTVTETYAHHILNALTPIQGYADLLAKKTDPSDPKYHWAEAIVKNAKEISEVIQSLRETTRYKTTALGGVKMVALDKREKEE